MKNVKNMVRTIVSLALTICLMTVNGENLIKENISIDNKIETSFSRINVEEQEFALEIESWMNSTNYWSGIEEIEEEFPLEIEPWMNSSNYWSGKVNKNISIELTPIFDSLINVVKYEPNKFVNEEMRLEIEKWNKCFLIKN